MRKLFFSTFIVLTVLVGPTLSPPLHVHADGTRTNLSYLYFGSPTSYSSQIDKTNNTLSTVSPSYFDIISGGALEVTWKLDPTFINDMHRRGIRVVPFLSNHWNKDNGIAALSSANREQLANAIVSAVQQYQLDGVNVDIEGVGSTYRDSFTAFIQLLRQKMPTDKEVSVAVAANPNGWTTGWHGFYDNKALADVADYLMVMSYDESWEGGPVGPVSSLSFVQRSYNYLHNLGITNDKIVLGIPFYGRIWKTDGTVAGLGVSNVKVAPLVTKYGGTVVYDETKQSPYATLTIPTGQTEYIAGKQLTAGNYIIWFENESSIKKKLRFINQQGVRGAGSWSLMQETADTWGYFSRWLNGRLFDDVLENYWAESAIIAMTDRAWMTGVTASLFAPEQSLTRAQGATILVRALGLTPTTTPSPFTDTATHWAKDAIATAYANGLVQGMSATTFQPDTTMTREQLCAILVRALHIEPTASDSSIPFGDVSTERWSYPAIQAMYQNGYIQGMSADQFGLRQQSSRAQMAAIMNRLIPLITAP